MKRLTSKLIIPLTVISFAIFTKWWYALPVDGPDTLFTGFPLPFVCPGFHTSMSLQFFLTEFVVDLFTYFLFWFILILCIDSYVTTINPHKIVTITLWTLTGLIIGGAAFITSNQDNVFYLKRPFEIEVMTTGYQFTWQNIERPDYYKYHPAEKNK